MSKKRNQVQFSKPEDPKFLKLIKQQAGYRDGPSIDTKRAKYDSGDDDSDYSDKDEELPQVVVVKSGDLTAEEAEQESKRLELENNTKPADLTERIVFKSKSKADSAKSDEKTAEIGEQSEKPRKSSKSSRKLAKETKSKLSFAFDDDDEEE